MSLSKERWKRKRKDGMNTKRDGEKGGWRWKAGVVGLTKKEGGGHTVERKGEKEKRRIRQRNSRGWRGRTEGGDSEGERKGEGEWVSA